MRILRSLILSAFSVMLTAMTVSAAMSLPAGLKQIEEEAFMDDSAVAGLVSVPESTESVGEDAFTGTGMFAMDLPDGVNYVGRQERLRAAYVRFRGAGTEAEGFSDVRCIIAPPSSKAQQWAETQNVLFVPSDAVLEESGFYYQRVDGALTLLCCVDASAVGHTAGIPSFINGLPVNGLSEFAFMGCKSLSSLTLPGSLKGNKNTAAAIADCPRVHIQYIDTEDGLFVASVTTDADGEAGGEVTWQVEGYDKEEADRFSYTLTKDGEPYSENTDSPDDSFSEILIEAGTYQLSVEISRNGAVIGKGISPKLFVTSEALNLSVPSSISNGENLSVEVTPLEGALSYYILITSEETGKSYGSRTLGAVGGTANFAGYTLEPGEYRVTGYVYGNDYASTVPTVEHFTVTAEARPACPELSIPSEFPAMRQVVISLTGEDYQINEPPIKSSPGVAADSNTLPQAVVRLKTTYPADSGAQTVPAGSVERSLYTDQYEIYGNQEGTVYELSFTIFSDGLWSEWSEPYTIVTGSLPFCPEPAVTFQDPETGAAIDESEIIPGQAVTIRVDGDSQGASLSSPRLYYLGSDGTEDPEQITDLPWRGGGSSSTGSYISTTLPVRETAAGLWRLESVLKSSSPYYVLENDTFIYDFTIQGDGAQQPEISTDKEEAYLTNDTIKLSIHAEDAESAYVQFVLYDGTKEYTRRTWTRSIDAEGNASLNLSTDFSSYSYDEGVGIVKVSVSHGGVWSGYVRLHIPLHKREQLAAPSVSLQTGPGLEAGQDLIFSFPPVEHADYYEAVIYNRTSNERVYRWDRSAVQPDTAITLPGYSPALVRGTYYLRVTAYAGEYLQNLSETDFTVSGSRSSGPDIDHTPDIIRIRDNVTFTISDPDAEAVQVFYTTYQDYSQSFESGSYYGTYGTSVPVIDGTGTHTARFSDSFEGQQMIFRAAVRRNGIWSGWKDFVFTVQGIPELETPVIYCNDSFAGGEDISIDFADIADAQNYHLRIYDENGSYLWGLEPSHPTVIDGYRLEVGTYRLRLEASADGWLSSYGEKVITITEKEGAPPSVTVDKENLYYGERAVFTITAPEADGLIARRSRGSSSPSYIFLNSFEDETEWIQGWSEDTRTYAFAALINGRWTDWSDPMTITPVGSAPQPLPAPVITPPESISLGQDLELTVESDGASYGYVYLYDASGRQITYRQLYFENGNTITIPGYCTQAGTMRLKAEVRADNRQSSSAEKTVIITPGGDRPAAPVVEPASQTAASGDRFEFEIPTEGADRVAVRYYRSGYSDSVRYSDKAAAGDITTWSDYWNDTGETWKYAFSVRQDGVWSPWSNICNVAIVEREN